jgi:hypothetical protein
MWKPPVFDVRRQVVWMMAVIAGFILLLMIACSAVQAQVSQLPPGADKTPDHTLIVRVCNNILRRCDNLFIPVPTCGGRMGQAAIAARIHGATAWRVQSMVCGKGEIA